MKNQKSKSLAKDREALAKKGLEFRLQHDQFTIGGTERGAKSIVSIDNPLRIDKLLQKGLLDEMQHSCGTQIYTLWLIANRPLCGGMNYSDVRGRYLPEEGALSRMTAEDQFYRTMMYLAAPHTDFIAETRQKLLKPLSGKERRALLSQLDAIERVNKKAHRRSHDLIVKICLYEQPVIEACRELGIAVNDSTACLKNAFDALGEALSKMRNYKKELEERSTIKKRGDLCSVDVMPKDFV